MSERQEAMLEVCKRHAATGCLEAVEYALGADKVSATGIAFAREGEAEKTTRVILCDGAGKHLCVVNFDSAGKPQHLNDNVTGENISLPEVAGN